MSRDINWIVITSYLINESHIHEGQAKKWYNLDGGIEGRRGE